MRLPEEMRRASGRDASGQRPTVPTVNTPAEVVSDVTSTTDPGGKPDTDPDPREATEDGTGAMADPASGMAPIRRGRRRLAALPAALVVIVLFVVVAQLPSVQSRLQDFGVLPRPVSYQSLYFAEPDSLPRSLRAGPIILRPTVEVANYGPDTKDLTWILSVTVDGGPVAVVGSGSIVVPRFSRADFSPQVQTVCTQPRIHVAYHLQDTAEQIGFWVNCT